MWDKRAYRAVYVGTDSRSVYELWDLRNKRFDHTHNCTLFEDEFPASDEFPQAEQYQRRRRGEKRIPPTSTVIAEPQQRPKSPEQPKSPDRPLYDTIVVEHRRRRRRRRPPPHESNAAQKHLVNENPSLEEALAGPNTGAWKRAML
jgi:hypothetical protein